MSKYTLTLANGSQIKGLSKNGTNYISSKKIDENIFNRNNLSTLTISDGETEEVLSNVVLVQQKEYSDGWHITFRELTDRELRDAEIYSKIEYISLMMGVDLEGV